MHGIYLINLANPDNQKFHLSKMSIVHYLDLAEKINAPGVVFHTGSFKDTEPEEGFSRIAKGIDWICDEAESSKPLFLECAAGAGGYVVGSKLEHLARIRDEVKNPERVKFCLDTQHLWASGYNLKGKLDEVVEEIDKVLGLDDVKCVHFNDSKVPFDSKKDRHENLGDGEIGQDAMTKILNHPKLKKLDFVMETPALKSMDTAQGEVDKLKSWAK
jgi:deoxyribonuclease-4